MTLIDPELTVPKPPKKTIKAPKKKAKRLPKKRRSFFRLGSKKIRQQTKENADKPTVPEDKLITKLPSSTIDFLPFNRIVNADCFAQTDGYYTDLVQFNMTPLDDDNQTEQDQGFYELYRQVLAYEGSVNWLFTEFPIDVSVNLHYLQHRRRLAKSSGNQFNEMATHAEELLQFIQHIKLSREAYLQLFAETPDKLEKLRDTLLRTNGQYIRLSPISLSKKIKIFYKFFNPLQPVIEGTPYQGMDQEQAHPRPELIQKVVDKAHYDPMFLSQIQPMGGVSLIDQNTINLGNGYMRVLHVYAYRQKNPMYWADRAFTGLGATVSMSLKTIDTSQMRESMSRSLNESEDRYKNGRTIIDQKQARDDYYSLDSLVEAVMNGSESLYQLHTRLYVAAQTLEDTVINGEKVPGLNSKVATIQDQMRTRGFQAMPYADEALQEFQAGVSAFDVQQKEIPRKGQELRGRSLAGSYPFLFAQFIDPTGLYIGQTLGSNGYVALNQFQHDRNRTSYSGWYIGKQGYGKSTAIKLTARNNTLLGHYTYLFMVSNEAKQLVESLGGLHVDGSKAIVNFLQIMPLVVDDQTNKILPKESFDASIKKASIIFNIASTVKDGSDVSDTFITDLQDFYRIWMSQHDMTMAEITNYAPEAYPIVSDFLAYIKKRKEASSQTESTQTTDTYTQLIRKLSLMIGMQSSIFNRHTALMPGDYQIIAFDMQNLIAIGSEIYNAQYYNLFNLVYSEGVKRGQHQKYLYENGQLNLDDVQATDIVSDEFHNVVRANNLRLLNDMDQANREGRKLWIALHWATQNLADVFPNFEERGEDDSAKAVRNLFALSPYRFIFRSDQANKRLMDYVFKGEISESDMEAIPLLETGCCVANIAGTASLKFQWELSDRERKLFNGGV